MQLPIQCRWHLLGEVLACFCSFIVYLRTRLRGPWFYPQAWWSEDQGCQRSMMRRLEDLMQAKSIESTYERDTQVDWYHIPIVPKLAQ